MACLEALYLTPDDEIDVFAKRLTGNVSEDLIVAGIETDRAADHRPAGFRLQRAHSADRAVSKSLCATPLEKWTLLRMASIPGLRRLVSRAVAEEFEDVASHWQLPAWLPGWPHALRDVCGFVVQWPWPLEQEQRFQPARTERHAVQESGRYQGTTGTERLHAP